MRFQVSILDLLFVTAAVACCLMTYNVYRYYAPQLFNGPAPAAEVRTK